MAAFPILQRRTERLREVRLTSGLSEQKGDERAHVLGEPECGKPGSTRPRLGLGAEAELVKT